MGMRVTEDRILQWLDEGRGQGHYSEFLAWIQITRRDSPSGGNLQDRYIPQFNRHFALLSANELCFARFILWLGVDDLREGFPCWTVPHAHPLYLNPHYLPSQLPWSKGSIHCAETLHIRHPCFPRTKIPYIPTVDLLATLRTQQSVRAVAFAIKPDEADVPLSEYDLVKLAITKEYCRQLEIPWLLVSSSMIPATLSSNLEVLLNYSGPLKDSQQKVWKLFIEELNDRLTPDFPILNALCAIQQSLGLDKETVQAYFHRALWFRRTRIDLRQAVIMSQPPVLNDDAWILKVSSYLLGE